MFRSKTSAVVLVLCLSLLAAACSAASGDSTTSAADQTATPSVAVAEEQPTATVGEEATPTPVVEQAAAPPAEAVAAPTEAPTETPAADAEEDSSGLTRIVMDGTSDGDYFVLYVRPDLSADGEIPVAVVLGEDGSTVISDGRMQLPAEHYRVETLSASAPGDVDADGIDDLTELASPTTANPVNPAGAVSIDDGAVLIPDVETFSVLSYQGEDVARDSYLAGLEYVKFWLIDVDGEHPTLYFMNTEAYRAHTQFTEAIGLDVERTDPGTMRGDIVYDPEAVAPDGTLGTYRFAFQPNDAYSFPYIALAFEMLSSGMPFLTDNLLYEPYATAALPLYEAEQQTYDAYRVPILLQP